MSQDSGVAVPPASRNTVARASSLSDERATNTVCAPSAASTRATSSPMPDEAPVTTTTRPSTACRRVCTPAGRRTRSQWSHSRQA